MLEKIRHFLFRSIKINSRQQLLKLECNRNRVASKIIKELRNKDTFKVPLTLFHLVDCHDFMNKTSIECIPGRG